ncbi:hypothetical protein GGU10DRAFT_33639 [Lentinula aff. detonsa]|uniref:ubiquitinyl hydrolase 1 n=1 Tax=Lentinula aff. detonsa TaxID=2804958 RepID=A0AA38NCJ6_9AGAR|nr:hypothetical protein GGU10DRAFT_33639 [Lentinula aff. detonsa]
MANPYSHGSPSYYDQSNPASYSYENHAGPSSYPYQYGVNGHAYQNYHPQLSHPHYIHAQNTMINTKQPQNYSHSPQQHPTYTYYSAPVPIPNSPPAWHNPMQQQPPSSKQLPSLYPYASTVETMSLNEELPLLSSSPPPPITATPSSPPPIDHSPVEHASSPITSPISSISQSAPMSSFSTTWAIWSRRPTNPILVPGLVFSSRIRPPDHIVSDALDIRTPPASPTIEVAPLPEIVSLPELTSKTPEDVVREVNCSVEIDSAVLPAITPLSSASTEGTSTTPTPTPTTTLPGSPASSTTSISVSAPAGVSKDVSSELTDARTSPEPIVTLPLAFDAPTASVTTTSPKSKPPLLTKSFASVLRPSTTSSLSPADVNAQRSRPRIPTSSVVGFSVPADAPSSSPQVGHLIPTGKRAQLLALLNSDHEPPSVSGPASSGISYAAISVVSTKIDSKAKVTPSQIHPRGLINTGNMCFANSVLQLLTYSPPFFRLFHELGRIGMDEVKQASGIRVPLVDATVEFLTEFIPEERKARLEEEMKKVNARIASTSSVNGASSSISNSVSGKGKERSMTPQPEDDFCPFIPTGIYDALKTKKQFDSMRGGQQEDAEEFLGFYLEGLEEELTALMDTLTRGVSSDSGLEGKGKKKGALTKGKAAVEETEEDAPPESEQDGWMEVGKRNRTVVTRTIKSTDSPITRIFGGKFRSSLRVPGQKESAIVEDWRSLRLDIQRDNIHTIQDALSNISQPQTVHLGDPPREGSQLVLIEALPPVLVLHMKRFEYDASVGGVVKVGKQVMFGPELVVGSDVLSAKARSDLGAKGARYKLFGAIYHHGISASGGHYTLDVLHPDRFPRAATAKPREGWIRIDDELVSDVRPEDVFGQGDFDDGGIRCAYLLFYRRMK